mgnify:CR=1 FL=1
MQVFPLKALEDNYMYVLHDEVTGKNAVVDPSEADPVLEFLKEKDWKLDAILNTHHHWDHVGGNLKLKKTFDCEVIGYEADEHRIPGISRELANGETVSIGGMSAQTYFIPGHTSGHIAYYFEKDQALFTGDTLFLSGCGRLFEGTYEQMFESLNLLKKFPDPTQIYCGHEYTLTNARFLVEIEPNDQNNKYYATIVEKLKSSGTTIPGRIEEEKRYNPFMRSASVEEFKILRDKKDHWKG